MSMTDPIADLFVRLQNAGRRGHDLVKMPASRVKGGNPQNFQKRRIHQGF